MFAGTGLGLLPNKIHMKNSRMEMIREIITTIILLLIIIIIIKMFFASALVSMTCTWKIRVSLLQ